MTSRRRLYMALSGGKLEIQAPRERVDVVVRESGVMVTVDDIPVCSIFGIPQGMLHIEDHRQAQGDQPNPGSRGIDV